MKILSIFLKGDGKMKRFLLLALSLPILYISIFALQRVILFDLTSCEIKAIEENVPSTIDDIIPNYYVKFESENLSYVVGKNKLDYIYLPLSSRFNIEVYDEHTLYCNKTFNLIINYKKDEEDIFQRYVEVSEDYEKYKLSKEEKSLVAFVPLFFAITVFLLILLLYNYWKKKRK